MHGRTYPAARFRRKKQSLNLQSCPLQALSYRRPVQVSILCFLLFIFTTLLPVSRPPVMAATLGDNATRIALSVVGSAYSYSGATPRTGFSCIGLVHWVYRQLGIEVPLSLQMAYEAFPKVPPNALEPGDVLFYQNTWWPGLSHAAIYIGNNQMVTADSPANGVRVDPLTWPYWKQRWYGAVRPWGNVSLPAAPGGIPVANGATIIVLADTLFVRSGPDRTYPDLALVNHNEVYPLLATYKGWDKIALRDGRTGWVLAQWVSNGPGGSPSLPASSLPAVQRQVTGRIALVIADQLRVHRLPDQTAALIGMAYKGDHYAVVAIQDGWVQIKWQSQLGWVAGLWVRLSAPTGTTASPAKAVPATSTRRVVTVIVDELRVRKGPGKDQPVLGTTHRGDHLMVTGSKGEWLQIQWTGQLAWVNQSYVQ